MYNHFDPDALKAAAQLLYDLEIQRDVVRSVSVYAGYGNRQPSISVVLSTGDAADIGTQREHGILADVFARYAPTRRYQDGEPGWTSAGVAVVHEGTWNGHSFTLTAYATTGSDLAIALGFPVAKHGAGDMDLDSDPYGANENV